MALIILSREDAAHIFLFLLFSKYFNHTSVLHKTDMRREFQFI